MEEKDKHKNKEQKYGHKKIEKDYNKGKKVGERRRTLKDGGDGMCFSILLNVLFLLLSISFSKTHISANSNCWSCLLRVIIYFSCSLSDTFK
jgi:hypothetical protein